MRHLASVLWASVMTLAWLVSASAWALDVKAGLWQISGEGMPDTQKVCYTRELLDADLTDLSAMKMPEGVSCKNEMKEQSPKFTVTHTSCSGPFEIEGDTRLEVLSPESMSMTSTSVMKIQGHEQSMTASARYTWLSSDCGDVKPFDIKGLMK